MDQNQYNNLPEEQEIDLVELIQKMWVNRGLIIKVTAAFMVLGLSPRIAFRITKGRPMVYLTT